LIPTQFHKVNLEGWWHTRRYVRKSEGEQK
jgi:hypothetical protein